MNKVCIISICGFWTYDNIPPAAIIRYIKKGLSDFLIIGGIFS